MIRLGNKKSYMVNVSVTGNMNFVYETNIVDEYAKIRTKLENRIIESLIKNGKITKIQSKTTTIHKLSKPQENGNFYVTVYTGDVFLEYSFDTDFNILIEYFDL